MVALLLPRLGSSSKGSTLATLVANPGVVAILVIRIAAPLPVGRFVRVQMSCPISLVKQAPCVFVLERIAAATKVTDAGRASVIVSEVTALAPLLVIPTV